MRNQAGKKLSKAPVRQARASSLVEKAKSRRRIKSDAELEVGSAHRALVLDYPEWLLSRKGAVPIDIDLEF
jgi:hypothetical protein